MPERRQHGPRVWVLLGEGAGGNAQMIALAEALGWPYETRALAWNPLNHLPNPLIGARAFTLDRRRTDALTPPWPDLVIAASRRSAPIARWIKRQSAGRTRLVHLLHAQAPLHHFDLVVTLAQFRVPHAPNVLQNTLPLNRMPQDALDAAAARWRDRFADLPRPWIAVLVGGDSSSYRFTEQTGRDLAARASRRARQTGGSLLVTTSRRTPEVGARALIDALDVPALTYRWQPDDADNPYAAFLALGDEFIVTADSASLPAEACATGRPVALFGWAPRRKPRPTVPVAKRFHRALIYTGWIKPRRDFSAFHDGLRRYGLVDRQSPAAAPPDDLARTVARIRRLMAASA